MSKKIPDYQTLAGQSFPSGAIGKNDVRRRIQNTTLEECKEYASLLEKSGFTQVTAKEISAGGACPYNVNMFYTYRKDEVCVFVFWDASIHTVFITAEILQALPSMEKSVLTSDTNVPPTFTQLQLRSGMCYIAQIGNGEFIVVDGGEYNEADEARLYAFLTERTPTGTPTIALWLFTHSHSDHIGLATHFIERYKEKISVLTFAYQFPDCDKISVTMESVEEMKEEIAVLEKNIASSYPNAMVYTLHTGQSYYFKGLEIEILWTIDDTYPSNYTSFNDFSAALRMKFKGDKTVLLLGDCMHEACRRLSHTYGDYLKSDMLQVTHHGLIGGDKGLYRLVDPEICFWATSEERFLGLIPNQRYQWCLGDGGCDYNAYLRDEKIRKRIHYHGSVTTTIEV